MSDDLKSYKERLEKTFLEELNYKIWVTKGSRFNASTRLLLTAHWSNLCQSVISVYLIAAGLLSVYSINTTNTIDDNLIAYSIIVLSIMLLVFGQIENAKDFKVKAKEFHSCGLELTNIYDKLRIFKTLNKSATEQEKYSFAEGLSKEYQSVLSNHENHHTADYELLVARNYQYHEKSWIFVVWVKIKYYFLSIFIYHLLIFLPPVIIIGFVL